MKSIFYNSDESRIRSFWRISLVTATIITLFFVWSVYVSGFIWLMAGLAIITLVVTWLACTTLDRRLFIEMGFSISFRWMKEFGIGCVIAALTMIAMVLTLQQTGYAEFWLDTEAVFSEDFLNSVLGLLMLMIAVSVWEELYFRGYLLRNLQDGFQVKNTKPWVTMAAAVVLSSFAFGFAHTSNPNSSLFSFINITIAGIVLAYPYIYTQSMAISVGLHLSWNYFQGVVFGLPVSGLKLEATFFQSRVAEPELLTGGQFGPEGGAIGLIGLIIMALLCSIYLHRIWAAE